MWGDFMRFIFFVLCLVTGARADHRLNAFRPRPVDLNHNELDPSGGIYPGSDNPVASLKPEKVSSIFEATSQEFPLLCRRNPPENIHRKGVEAFREMPDKTDYESQYGGLAKKALAQAKKAGGNLWRVAREFRFTKAGDEAALDNLSFLFQLGSYALFAPYFNEFEKDHPTFLSACDESTQLWASQAFFANRHLNKIAAAKRYAGILKKCDPSENETDRALAQKIETPPPFNPTLQAQFTREVAIYTGELSLCAELEGCDPKNYCAFHAQFSTRDLTTLADPAERPDKVRELYGDFVAKKIALSPRRLKDQIRFLTHLLSDPDQGVAAVAANALVRFPAATSKELFVPLLKSPNRALFDEARRNLEAKGPESTPLLIKAGGEERGDALRRNALVNSYYMTQLSSPDRDLRTSAVKHIDVTRADALPRILNALKDSEAGVREAALERLYRNIQSAQQADGLESVFPLLKDPDDEVKGRAVELLTAFLPLDPAAEKKAAAEIHSADKSTRDAISPVLRFLGKEKIIFDSLVAALEGKDENVRRSAYECVKGVNLLMEKERIATVMEKLFPSKSAEARLAAVSLTWTLSDRWEEALPYLNKFLKDPDKRVAAAAAEQLEAIKNPGNGP